MGELFVLVGPTGVGKTAYALALAQQYHCPIINADSRQIYKELPIGTAAPTAEEQALVKHYFVGTKSILEEYNAGEYEREALAVIEMQNARYSKMHRFHQSSSPREMHRFDSGVIAILTGGSMMYIDAVCNGLDDIPTIAPAVRQEVQERYSIEGLGFLQREVERLDPAYWAVVDRANPQRLMHCIEICYQTGEPYSRLRHGVKRERPFTIRKIGLNRDRDELYDRINKRVLKMVDEGLVEEARKAFALCGEKIPNSLNTVGYKEMHAYLKGQCTLDEAIEQIQRNTRHYAKRQLTWWRRDKEITWI